MIQAQNIFSMKCQENSGKMTCLFSLWSVLLAQFCIKYSIFGIFQQTSLTRRIYQHGWFSKEISPEEGKEGQCTCRPPNSEGHGVCSYCSPQRAPWIISVCHQEVCSCQQQGGHEPNEPYDSPVPQEWCG